MRAVKRLAVPVVALLAALGVLAWLALRVRGDQPAGRDRSPESGRRESVAVAVTQPPAAPPAAIIAPDASLVASPPDPTDPSRPTYDADKLIRAHPEMFREQYAREPRDDPWATHREVLVRALALQRLREVDPAADLEIECHTAICKIVVSTKNQALDRWLESYPLGGCLAPTYASTKAGDMYLVFDQTTRDPDGMIAASDKCDAEQHDRWLSAVRAGRAPWEPDGSDGR